MYGYCPVCKHLVNETDFNIKEQMCWVCWVRVQEERRLALRILAQKTEAK